MRIHLYLFVILVALITSCTSNKTKRDKEKISDIVELKNTEANFSIEGMTCQIGCAKIIASKLSKLNGVKNVNVSFENKLGTITYNSNEVDKQQIIDTVEKIADGSLYKVTSFEYK